jgi:hypothetical protein
MGPRLSIRIPIEIRTISGVNRNSRKSAVTKSNIRTDASVTGFARTAGRLTFQPISLLPLP